MSISTIGFVPAAPLLIPSVAGGSVLLDDDLRAAARDAVQRLIADELDEVLVAAPTTFSGEQSPTATWDFSGFGVPRLDGPIDALPWQLGIGAWLLDDAGWLGRRRYVGVGADSAEAGVDVSADGRRAILAVGDGSACRTEKAPGYLDPRAEAFDAHVAHCLAAGDLAGLGAIDPDLAAELLCAGAPVWRWLAQGVGTAPVTSASVTFSDAPYGVAYFVASWTLA